MERGVVKRLRNANRKTEIIKYVEELLRLVFDLYPINIFIYLLKAILVVVYDFIL